VKKTRVKSKRPRRTKAAEVQDAAVHADEAATLSDDQTSSPPTNLYTDEELRIAAEASAAYDRIKTEYGRQREDWLNVIGPALLIARTGAMKIAGTTNVRSQAYRDAIPGELERLNLTKIERNDRSLCLKIMDNLEDVEAWLAQRPNPDRLNHPKTIWQAFDRDVNGPDKGLGWEDDPGYPAQEEEYHGIESEDDTTSTKDGGTKDSGTKDQDDTKDSDDDTPQVAPTKKKQGKKVTPLADVE
jgi:hypothetical protein